MPARRPAPAHRSDGRASSRAGNPRGHPARPATDRYARLAIGFVAFAYGKKMTLWKPMVIGVALMAYPYFISQPWILYAVGCVLCLGLYVFRE